MRLSFLIGLLFTTALCSIPQLSVDQINVLAAGEFDVVYNIDICDDGTLTNWTFGTNIIGNGTNYPPEIIDAVGLHPNRAYRISPE